MKEWDACFGKLSFIDTVEGDSPESSEENHETDAIVEVIPEPEEPANEPLLQGTEQTLHSP